MSQRSLNCLEYKRWQWGTEQREGAKDAAPGHMDAEVGEPSPGHTALGQVGTVQPQKEV